MIAAAITPASGSAEADGDKKKAWACYSAGLAGFSPADEGYAILYQPRAGVR